MTMMENKKSLKNRGANFPLSLYVPASLLKEEGIGMMCGFPATHEL